MTRRTVRNYALLPVAIALVASLGRAQSGTTTRIEENDKSIIYQGTWYTNGNPLNSGGSSALTNAPGATVVLNFTGTGITWIGALDPWSGMATVYLDGTLNTVDTYGGSISGSTLYQQALFKARGLTNGPHTLSIEVIHRRDANGLGSWIWIDAFDIENGSGVTGAFTAGAGRTEQSSPALTYTGTWLPNTSSVQSGGSAVLATNSGSRATISFKGTGITWVAYRDEWSGIARVYVDGVLKQSVDTYLSPFQAQAPAYVIEGLVSGTHTLTIEATGTHSSASSDSWIWVDAFDVVDSGSAAVPPSPVEVSPGAGSGASQTFAFTYTDPAGGQNFSAADVLINSVLDARQSCSLKLVMSGAAAGALFLADDSGVMGAAGSAVPLPGSGSASNSQCSVSAGGSSVSWSGNTLTLTLAITFNAAFSGNKVVYLAAHDKLSNTTGWKALGTWGVPGFTPIGPAVGGVSPAQSNAQSQSYTFTFTDTKGGQDIAVATALINGTLDGRQACYLAFVPSGATAGEVYLVDDAATSYQALALPGTGSIANSQCSIAATGSSVSASGDTLTLTIALTFAPAFSGNRIIFVEARSMTLSSGWQTVGNVTLP